MVWSANQAFLLLICALLVAFAVALVRATFSKPQDWLERPGTPPSLVPFWKHRFDPNILVQVRVVGLIGAALVLCQAFGILNRVTGWPWTGTASLVCAALAVAILALALVFGAVMDFRRWRRRRQFKQ